MKWTHLFKKSDQIEPDFENPLQYESYGHEAHDLKDPTEPVPVLWILDGGRIKTMPALPGYNHFFFYKDSLEEVEAGTRDVALNVFHTWRGRFDFKDSLITADIAEESIRDNAPVKLPSPELRKQLIERYIEESGGERPVQINSYVGGIHTDVLEDTDFAQDILQDAVPLVSTEEPVEDRRLVASSKPPESGQYTKDEYEGQITDKDRYTSDKYKLNIDLSETRKGYSVSFYLYNFQVGVAAYVQYWHYDLDEQAEARQTFKELKDASKKLLDDLNYNHPPMAIIIPSFRSILHPIDIGHKEKSGIDSYNRYMDEVEKASDWRSTLYGTRYPTHNIEVMNEHWVSKNTDDKSRKIEPEGTSSRDETYKFKYSSKQTEKQVLSQFHLPQGPVSRDPNHITRHDAMALLRQVIQEMPPGQGQRYWNQIAVRLKALIPPEQHREMLRYLNNQYLQRQGSIQNNWNVHF